MAPRDCPARAGGVTESDRHRERRADLRRTYLRLGTGELVAAIVFAVLAQVTVRPRLPAPDHELVLWVALLPLEVVLLQAGVYWLLARSWLLRAPMPAATATAYRCLRAATALLLVVSLLVLLVLLVLLPDEPLVAALVLAIWACAAVEFVNYYLIRLAYPVGGWVAGVRARREPRLARDLRVARQRSTG